MRSLFHYGGTHGKGQKSNCFILPTGITELNYRILHQLIDKILVSKAEKVDGEYVQKIQIFYRFIGPLDAIE